VRLTVGRQALQPQQQPLVVKLDPRCTASDQEIARQTELGLKAWRELRRATALLREVSKTAPAGPAERSLKAAISGLTAVLNVVSSADRSPPQQAYDLYEQSVVSLEAAVAESSRHAQ
jgi:hypothetical protein